MIVSSLSSLSSHGGQQINSLHDCIKPIEPWGSAAKLTKLTQRLHEQSFAGIKPWTRSIDIKILHSKGNRQSNSRAYRTTMLDLTKEDTVHATAQTGHHVQHEGGYTPKQTYINYRPPRECTLSGGNHAAEETSCDATSSRPHAGASRTSLYPRHSKLTDQVHLCSMHTGAPLLPSILAHTPMTRHSSSLQNQHYWISFRTGLLLRVERGPTSRVAQVCDVST